MIQPQTEELYSSQIISPHESLSRPKTLSTNAPKGEGIKLPELSQFLIACYAGSIALVALYVAHTSANMGADAAILANKIAAAGIDQAQAANQIQLLQLCLLNNVCTCLWRSYGVYTALLSFPKSKALTKDS
jgi:hypothetical protein